MAKTTSDDGALLVLPSPHQLGQAKFLRTSDGSALMNVDGRANGTGVNIWDGTGAGDTGTGDWTVDGIGSETAGSNHAGTNGWDTGVSTLVTEQMRFTDPGGDSDINGTYEELRFWMQPKAFPAGARLRINWQDNSNTSIGTTINVANYVTNYDLDVWQQVSIPISDFNLGANVAKLRFRFRNVVGQQFWFDDVELGLIGTGGPFRYQDKAPAGQRHHLSMLVLVIVADDAGWAGDAFADIVGGLPKGLIIRQRRLSDGEILWSLNSKDNIDLFGRYHPQEVFNFSDSTQLVGLMLKPGSKASVVVTDDEVLEFVVRDDLSGLAGMRAFAHYGVEVPA